MREITQEEVDKVDVVTRIGRLMLGSACSASEVVYTTLKVAQKLGLRYVSVDLSYSHIQVSYQPPDAVSHSVVRTISGRQFDYGRQTRVKQLADEIVAGRRDHVEAARDLEWIQTYPGPYPKTVVHIFSGMTAAAAALVFGGNFLVCLLTFISAIILDYIFAYCERHFELPIIFLQIIAGVVGEVAGIVTLLIDPNANASVVVIAVIMFMLAGMTSTGAVNDAITGWHLTGVGRISEALVNTLGLVIGVRLGILLSHQFGFDITISEQIRPIAFDGQAWEWLVGCIMFGVSLAVYAQTPKRALPWICVVTPAIYILYILASTVDIPTAWATAIGAIAAGLIGTVLSKMTTVTSDAFAVCAILPLMPGSMIYRALWAMTDHPALAINYAMAAIGTAVAIAAGLTLGQYFGAALLKRADRTYAAILPVFHKPYASLRERRERARRRRQPAQPPSSMDVPEWLTPKPRDEQ